MKKLIYMVCAAILWVSQAAAQPSGSWTADNGNGTFTNPLFYDEFSDPDLIRVGEDFYLAGTTMHCTPGVVILHSKDLVNWEFLSYCFERFDMGDEFRLENGKEAYGQGIWAPWFSQTSTAMACKYSLPKILPDRGSTSTWAETFMTCPSCLMMTARYTPYISMTRCG